MSNTNGTHPALIDSLRREPGLEAFTRLLNNASQDENKDKAQRLATLQHILCAPDLGNVEACIAPNLLDKVDLLIARVAKDGSTNLNKELIAAAGKSDPSVFEALLRHVPDIKTRHEAFMRALQENTDINTRYVGYNLASLIAGGALYNQSTHLQRTEPTQLFKALEEAVISTSLPKLKGLLEAAAGDPAITDLPKLLNLTTFDGKNSLIQHAVHARKPDGITPDGHLARHRDRAALVTALIDAGALSHGNGRDTLNYLKLKGFYSVITASEQALGTSHKFWAERQGTPSSVRRA